MSELVRALRGVLGPIDADPPPGPDRPAAVMVPVLDLPEPSLLFTVRSMDVRDHKGEISFPGGVRHREDPDLLHTALRETEEELGIPADRFEVLGSLPPTQTVVSGFLIAPFVGVLADRPRLRPSPVEIDEVLELEVRRLVAVEREAGVDRDGERRTWFAYDVDGNTVWGATGRIVHSFLAALRDGGWNGSKED
ncbi:MAG TPA: CoA pyrophosphatase [Actinomycetota bacterium]|nr:CoA pyrophosphatase [Actinomycetota bacterium]